jgi:futalosine hydrolase
MSFKILYVTATSAEANILAKIKGMVAVPGGYRYGDFRINLLIGGIGSVSTAWAMKQWISVNEAPDLAINAGIAGSYKDEYAIGDVVIPESDCFADAGVEDGESFFTLGETGLAGDNEFPFTDGLIPASSKYCVLLKTFLKPVKAITLNTSTGSEVTMSKLIKKFNPDIETMEGATFFYICAREKIPFLALRAISNKVGPRDINSWNIPVALENLATKLIAVLLRLE